MQSIFDDVYAKSIDGQIFNDFTPFILSTENILIAYRNIKANTGSETAETDKLTIKDTVKLSTDEVVEKVRYILTGTPDGYRPNPVRRNEIPKPYNPTKNRNIHYKENVISSGQNA